MRRLLLRTRILPFGLSALVMIGLVPSAGTAAVAAPSAPKPPSRTSVPERAVAPTSPEKPRESASHVSASTTSLMDRLAAARSVPAVEPELAEHAPEPMSRMTSAAHGDSPIAAVAAVAAVAGGAGIPAALDLAYALDPTTPSAPTNVAATAGDASATVTWTAPATDGGSPITGYTVTASPGGATATTTGATTATVAGLTNGTSYTFTVKATNAVGDSVASAPSGSTIPARVTGPPTNPAAIAGNGQAVVTWTPPTGGDASAPVTGYTITATPGGTTWTVPAPASWQIVSGLTNGVAYTFAITATNRIGTSNSVSSAPVTPHTPDSSACTNATIVWTGAAQDGLWSTTANWSPARVPTSTDQVCLPEASIPLVTASTSVGGLVVQLGAALEVSASGHLSLGGLTNNGTVLVNSTAQVFSASCTAVITNNGVVQVSTTISSALFVSNQGCGPDGLGHNLLPKIYNSSSGTIESFATSTASVGSGPLYGPVMENDGLVIAHAGTLVWYSSAWTGVLPQDGVSTGRFAPAGGAVQIAGVTANSTTQFDDGVVVIGGLAGTVSLPQNVTLTLASGGFISAAVSGAGWVTVQGGAMVGDIVGNVRMMNPGGTLGSSSGGVTTIEPSATVQVTQNGAFANVTIVQGATVPIGAAGHLSLSGAFTNNGTVSVNSTVQVFLASCTAVITNNGVIQVNSAISSALFSDSACGPNGLGQNLLPKIYNSSSGTIESFATTTVSVGSGPLYGPVMENDGLVIAHAGTLVWYSSAWTGVLPQDGVSTGRFSHDGGGIQIGGVTANSSTQFDDGVVVIGGLAGTVSLPANVTLILALGGFINAVVSGAGWVSVQGGTMVGDIIGNVRMMNPGGILGNSSGVTTIEPSADVEVTQNGTFTNVTIVAGATVTIGASGHLFLSGAITNNGTVSVNSTVQVFLASCTAVITNNATIRVNTAISSALFSDSACGPNGLGQNLLPKIYNSSSGTIESFATATVSVGSGPLYGPVMENDGLVIAHAGTLVWYSSAWSGVLPQDGVSTGRFELAGGVVQIGGVTADSTTQFDNGVVVIGPLTGTVSLPQDVTIILAGGFISAVVSGPGWVTIQSGSMVGDIIGNVRMMNPGGTLGGAATTIEPSADVEVTQNGTFTNVTIVAAATVTIGASGHLFLSGAITNNGKVLVNSTVQLFMVSCTAVITNNGVIQVNSAASSALFSDSACGPNGLGQNLLPKIYNSSSGTIESFATTTVSVGSGPLYGPVLENDGQVIAYAGTLVWYSSVWSGVLPQDGVSTGRFGHGSGSIQIGGVTTNSTTQFDDGVVVIGPLTGTVSLPANITLIIGSGGTLYAPTSGLGSLHVAYLGSVAVDLSVPSVQMDAGSSILRKLDLTATTISAGTTVTLLGTPSLGSSLSLINNGTLDFRANGYFNCSTCSFVNAANAYLVVNNPDGNVTHTFTVSSGSFENDGIIRETGYYPGVALTFGSQVTHAGRAEMHNMSQSPAVIAFRDNAVAQFLNGITPNFLGLLATVLGQQNLTIGAGACEGVSAYAGIGGSATVCLVIGPDSKEALAITFGIGAGINVSATADQGVYALWRTGGAGETTFDAYTDMDGPFVCEGTTIEIEIAGVAAQHCWGAVSDQPFDLDNPVSWAVSPGVHTAFLGVSEGPGLGAGSLGVSDTITISCTTFTSLTWHQCPPINTAGPTISGTAYPGQTLTSSTGTWDPRLPDSVTYQWQRCVTSSPSTCSDIVGATTSQYVVTDADRGHYLAVYALGHNDGTVITSGLSALVSVPST